MYHKILVPLDGSELAECVLPHVEAIAKGCLVKNVIFMHVVEPFRLRSGEYAIKEEEEKRIDSGYQAAAESYLSHLVERLSYNGVNVQAEAISGSVAPTIADYAADNEVDLIIMATHGRSGVSRWVWGSVADRILHAACVPVLMVRAPGCVPDI